MAPNSALFLSKPKSLAVVNAGFSKGQLKPGVETGPAALLKGGLLDQLKGDLGYEIHTVGHWSTYDEWRSQFPTGERVRGMTNPRLVSAVCQDVASNVYSQLTNGHKVLTLGGDHSIGLGTVAGTAKAVHDRFNGSKIGVIWVDAHADINTPETSGSGNTHGMPLAWLLGLARSDQKDVFGWIEDCNRISADKLVYIGLRDLDQSEKDVIREKGIQAFSMQDVIHYGIRSVMDMALSHIGRAVPIHLGFDIDGLDPYWAPSTGFPVDGGLSLPEGNYIASRVHQTGQLVAMDLVEVNPKLNPEGAQRTIDSAISVIRFGMGDSQL